MRPVVFESRKVILSAFDSVEIAPTKIWKNELFAQKLLAAGFKQGEDMSICYKVFTDEYAFIGDERAITQEASADKAERSSDGAGVSTGNSRPGSVSR